MENINKDGYLLIPNFINNYNASSIIHNISDDTVDVKSVKTFIDSYFIPYVTNLLHLNDTIVYNKFRYSNNNNSTDAATFHNDIYNYTNMNKMPLYTCLCYFDAAQMELIPKSHIKDNRTFEKVIQNYRAKKVIDIPENSILIINAGLFHRGKGFVPNKQRRLLQIFDCFFSKNELQTHYKQLNTVKTNKLSLSKHFGELLKSVALNKNILDSFVFIHFIIDYYHLKYKLWPVDIPFWQKNNTFVGYEFGPSQDFDSLTKKNDFVLPTNINIICNNWCVNKNTSNFYFYVFLVIIILCTICFNISIMLFIK